MNIKKIILILVILLCIALIILATLLIYGKYQENYEYDPPTNEIKVQVVSTVEKVDVKNNYYTVKSCIEKFYQYLTEVDENDIFMTEEMIQKGEKIYKQAIYAMLDERYIQCRNITVDNVLEIIPRIADSTLIIDNMYVSQKDINMSAYIVYGRIRNNQTNEKTNFEMLVELDMLNRSFKIILQDYINENIGEINEGDSLNLEIPASIEKNSYNTFDYESVTDEDYIVDIFNEFKNNMINDHEIVYEKLNQEYKEKRFETYEKFDNYAVKNIMNSVSMKMTSYKKSIYEGYTQYTCVDQNNNYYIFYVTDIMNYTVILDTYTIDLPEFVAEYNSADDARKVQLNISKVFEAINDGDYNYVYNKLDDTFKQNNFPTLEEFEQYMENTFYDNNSVGYTNYQTSGNLHIYELSITDKDNTENPTVTKNFIMQLLDETDFVMSFNV